MESTRSRNLFVQKVHLRSLNERNKTVTQSSQVFVWLDFMEGRELSMSEGQGAVD